jgi:hypothetical protein
MTVPKCFESGGVAVPSTWTSIYVSPGEYPDLGLSATFGAYFWVVTRGFLNGICPGRLGSVPMWAQGACKRVGSMPGSVASKLACAANALNSPAYPLRFVQGGSLNLEKWVRI